MLQRIGADDTEVLDLIDATMQGKHGGDHTSEQSKSNNVSIAHRPVGNNRQQALRKLRKDSPTLHAEVLTEKTLAAKQKGRRPESNRPFVS